MDKAKGHFPRINFSELDPEKVVEQVDACLQNCRDAVTSVEQQWRDHFADDTPILDTEVQANRAWDALIEPVSSANNTLELCFAPVRHLNAVMSTPQWREAHDSCLPRLIAWHTELGQNAILYAVTQYLLKQGTALNVEQHATLEQQVRDFELSGVALSDEGKARFATISERLGELGSGFSNHVLDATDAYSRLVTDETELKGLPEFALAAARQRAEQEEKDGWLFSLEFPSYHAVMTYADSRELREALYIAYNSRASDQGPNAGEYDNNAIMIEILNLRAEKAQLLGYENYAELSMVPKMVQGPDQVLTFLSDLAERASGPAQMEFEALQAFALERHDMDDISAWDIAWLSEQLKQERFAISDEELKPWFPADRVIPGMFSVVERLFDVSIRIVDGAPTYHADVKLYRINDFDGSPLGEFYLDPFARKAKRGGAWMDGLAGRYMSGEQAQLPMAWLVCNLTPPIGDQPALLTHNDVLTLFHEFGHGLHHMLTRVNVPEVAGINGVEWDAVELPSQFLEYWCWERESLDLISAHYQTGEPLPEAMLERMRAARNFQSAMQLLRQIEFSLFDMHIHLESDAGMPTDVMQVLSSVREQVAVVPYPDVNRFPHAFSHIFAGGYAAGYFSYKWAEVLSADAFSRFEEEGVLNAETGRSFRTEILERGSTRPALESFVAFRGREPDVSALLRHSGLAA